MSQPTEASPMPDLRAAFNEALGAAKTIHATSKPKYPSESFLLLAAGIAGTVVAAVVPGLGEVARAATVATAGAVTSVVAWQRHSTAGKG